MGGSERVPETGAFARLMRELKEGSGLSYGVLAKRLHVSTSTLHRYCNGDAVPTEFATVDRFARACGAGRDQALALHRAWLLADARRRSAVPGEEAAAEATVPAAAEEPGAGPGEDAAGAAAGAGEGSAGLAARTAGEPAAGPATGDRAVESGAAAARPAAGSAAGGGAVEPGGPAPAAVVEEAHVPVGAGGRRDRRWWWGGAAAVAVVSAVAVGAAGLTGGTPGREQRGAAAVRPSPQGLGGARPQGTPTGVPASAAPTGTGSPAPGASASVSGSPSAPGTARPSASAPGTRAPAEPPAGAAPLAVSVRSHVWANGCDHAYLSERGPADVPPPPAEQDAPAWAAAQRAVHGKRQIVEATVTGAGPGPVVLQALDVRVVGRRAPLRWNLYGMSMGCGGALTPAAYAVNLDAPRPLARPLPGNDAGEPLPAPALPLKVSAADPAVIRVEAATTGCDCDWYLELRWVAGDRSGTVRIDAAGRPFRTSAALGPSYGYAYDRGGWARD
ncbi:helix-turn-helix domain-containing protein [Streptomyces sp. NPDC089919]|uniref:helix-turn-helix domain-containing protein n=1 Tax=Streptomyces sp. NPDC089919 TaxID=3155188 RepID=UPI00341A0107